MIRLAQISDLNELENVLINIKNTDDKTTINMWDETYPTIKILESDIIKKRLYVCVLENDKNIVPEIVGFFVINNIKDEIYSEIDFRFMSNNLFLHRFCIVEKFRGKIHGFSNEMINFVITYGINNRFSSIILDTHSTNIASNKFYKKHAFRFVSSYNGRKGTYNAYEKVIDNKKIVLSKRLKTIADFIEYDNFVDVGTDHALLPIYAVQNNIAKKVIASDFNSKPLKIGEENVVKYDLLEIIELRLGSGISTINPFEIECLTIAGMGAKLIEQILLDNRDTASSFKQLVLQPQLYPEVVRRVVHSLGFVIKDEALVYEEMRFYNIINCVRSDEIEQYTNFEYKFGKKLIENKDPNLYKFLAENIKKLEKISRNIKPTNEALERRKAEIDEEILLCKEAQNVIED